MKDLMDFLLLQKEAWHFFFFLMIRRPPRSTLDRSSAASDVYKRQAKTKLIFVPAGPTAKATMDLVVAQARKGVDFVKLVKQHSADQDSAAKDGDFADITPDSKVPEAIRKTIFTTKPGQLTPVIPQPAGLYLFEVTAVNMRPLEDVAQETRSLTGQQRAVEWMEAEKKKASVKIIHEAFFKSLNVTA